MQTVELPPPVDVDNPAELRKLNRLLEEPLALRYVTEGVDESDIPKKPVVSSGNSVLHFFYRLVSKR